MRKAKRIFKIKKSKYNPFVTMMALSTATSIVQIEIIKSQPGPLALKILSIAEAMQNFADSIKRAQKSSDAIQI